VGDVAVHDASEAAALADIAVITGALIIDDTALDELALPRLVQVRGGIEVKSNAALAHVALPALQSVDGPLAPIDLCNATKGRLWIQPSGAVTVQIEDGMIAHAQCFTSLDGASYAM
jgi:hypothetical protein